MGGPRTEEPNPRINFPTQANKGKQTPRAMPTRGKFKSQMETRTHKKPKDKGIDGKVKVQDMLGWGKEVS